MQNRPVPWLPYFFPKIAETKSECICNWHTIQVLAQTDTALLRKRARFMLACVILQNAEIAIESLETLNMQTIR